MRIAIIGTRGIPARYGGFETMAMELSGRLSERGHEVTVYCRKGATDEGRPAPAGVARRFVPMLRGKYTETVTHTAMSIADAVVHPYDAILLVNAANAVFAALPRVRGTVVALNVDGIERQRAKWGPLGRAWYSLGERFALVFPNEIITDAGVIRDYYVERYSRPTTVIAYGARVLSRAPAPDLESYGLIGVEPGRFLLYVSRLEPENQADLVVRAYRRVPGDMPLLIVGDAPYADEFKRQLSKLAADDPRVRLTGGIYGQGYEDLLRSAAAYIHATTVGGTHPALIEAMGAGNLVLCFETPENLEVASGAARFFGTEDELEGALCAVVERSDPDLHAALRAEAAERVRARYSWDAIGDAYDELLRLLVARRRRSSLGRRGRRPSP
jgi:glycosyltransferase involved in cell wall biosynthesis